MTKIELGLVLDSENIRNMRVNGFKFSHSGTTYAVLKGRIPLSLARKIHEGINNKKLLICVHGNSYDTKPEEWATNAELTEQLSQLWERWKSKVDFSYDDAYTLTQTKYIMKLEKENRIDDLYILYYHIHTAAGVRHVIKCIRESGCINQCLFD